MIAEIICVGTELLLGNIVNTNAAYLAEQCAMLGVSSYFQVVVGDNKERLMYVIKTAAERSDVVILCGGLGPTEDDLTKETVAEFCNRKMYEDAHSKACLEQYFAARGLEMTENNLKQVMIPEGAKVLDNPNGTAPGVIVEEEQTKYILLPGPPMELQPMFENHVMTYLKGLTGEEICSQTVKLCGASESKVETQIKDLIDAQSNPTIATYAKPGDVHIRVTAKAANQKEANKIMKPVVKELKSRFGHQIYTTDEKVTLEKAVVELLQGADLTIGLAESCTAGMLSARLVNVPGVSDVYKMGVTTYSNKAKRTLLNVKKSTLRKHGAVSQQTAEEMVKGCAQLTGADVTVAITGVAGPDGGTEEKPVGLVYIACNVKGNIRIKKHQLKGSRSKIRENTTSLALTLVRECVMEYLSRVTFGKK